MPKIGALKRAACSTFAVSDPYGSTKRTLHAKRPNFWCVVIPVRKWEECFPKQSDNLQHSLSGKWKAVEYPAQRTFL